MKFGAIVSTTCCHVIIYGVLLCFMNNNTGSVDICTSEGELGCLPPDRSLSLFGAIVGVLGIMQIMQYVVVANIHCSCSTYRR